MSDSNFPAGWDEERVRRVFEHYERQTPEEAVAEDEAAFENENETVTRVPHDLVPAVRELIARHQGRSQCELRMLGGSVESRHIIDSVVKFGTDAVDRYQKMSEKAAETVQEYFLRSFIAMKLHESLGSCVQLETLYTDVAWSLGVRGSELNREIGGQKADITLFEDAKPCAIIELKILGGAGRTLQRIQEDARKLIKLSDICKIPGYIAVLICKKTGPLLEEQIARMEKELNLKVHRGGMQSSPDTQWQWCFGCSLVSDNLQPEGIGDVT